MRDKFEQALQLIRDQYIAEAAHPRKNNRILVLRGLAFAAAVAAVFALVFGIPFGNTSGGIISAPGVFVVRAYTPDTTVVSSITDLESIELQKDSVTIDPTRHSFSMVSNYLPGILLSLSVPEEYGTDISYQVVMPEAQDMVYQRRNSKTTFFRPDNRIFHNGEAVGCIVKVRGEETERGVWEDKYISFILYDGDAISGYVVIKAGYVPNSGENKQHYSGLYTAELLDAVYFPKVNGKHQQVSMDYVNQQLANLINNDKT